MKEWFAAYQRWRRIPPIEPGQRWRFRHPSGNPFRRNVWDVEVLAIRLGWVQYAMESGRVYEWPERNFRDLYAPILNPAPPEKPTANAADSR